MPSAIDSIVDDFARELETIRSLLAVTAANPTTAPGSVGVRLAASNASMLLLAASFEEFVRQSVLDYATALIDAAANGEAIPDAFLTSAWDRALFLLRGEKYGKATFDVAGARANLDALIRFCLDKQPIAAVAPLVKFNANNVTVSEFNDVFRRVGIDNLAVSLCSHVPMLTFFDAEDALEAHGYLLTQWEEFYRERNRIAHSIGEYRATGVADILKYVGMYEAVAESLRVDFAARI